MEVVDELFYHLDNRDMILFRYPISILVWKEYRALNKVNLDYFIRLIKVFVIKPKLQNKYDQRKRHYKQMKLDIGFSVVGKTTVRN